MSRTVPRGESKELPILTAPLDRSHTFDWISSACFKPVYGQTTTLCIVISYPRARDLSDRRSRLRRNPLGLCWRKAPAPHEGGMLWEPVRTPAAALPASWDPWYKGQGSAVRIAGSPTKQVPPTISVSHQPQRAIRLEEVALMPLGHQYHPGHQKALHFNAPEADTKIKPSVRNWSHTYKHSIALQDGSSLQSTPVALNRCFQLL